MTRYWKVSLLTVRVLRNNVAADQLPTGEVTGQTRWLNASSEPIHSR